MKKIILATILFLVPAISLAAGLVPCGGQGEPICELCHFFVLFDNVIRFLLNNIVFPLAILMIAIGGFMYIFAYVGPSLVLPGGGKGGPALLNQAKKLITAVIIGLVITFAAWIIVNTFFMIIGVASWTGLESGWFKIECNP